MQSEVLLCDIGNTSLKIGLANAEKLLSTYVFPASRESTADSIGLALLAALRHAALEPEQIGACLAASVAPALDSALAGAVRRYLNCHVFFVPQDVSVPLANKYSQPAQLGADRLVGAYAARRAFPDAPSLIVADFGTAVTFDCVCGDAYLGGLIFPGPAAAVAALAQSAAKLPHINLDGACLEAAPGLDTASGIQRGLIFGYICLSRGLCELLGERLAKPVKIVATGGFAARLAGMAPIFDVVMPNLILEGLMLLCKHGGVFYRQT